MGEFIHSFKRNTIIGIFLSGLFMSFSCGKTSIEELNCDGNYLSIDENTLVTRICFGSCANQNIDQPVLYAAIEKNPDLFIYLGDNIYGDTRDMDVLAKKYNLLCAKPEFQLLQETCPILAVWDDHDYGENDAGLEYKKKAESKEVFMHFWGEENNFERWEHEGIYHSYMFEENQNTLQIILLDVRTFRSEMDYEPNYDQEATMLGEIQWQWLEKQLEKPAEIRIIASSTQFSVEENGFEAWANFPLEQERMYNLIETTNASGVFFISGDIHYSELSKRETTNTYPIYDFTASGITETYPTVPNQYRIGNSVEDNNVGMIDIDWDNEPVSIIFSVIDVSGSTLLEQEITLDEISF